MDNAIRFGIYRIVIGLIFIFSFLFSSAQDLVLTTTGDTIELEISSWYLNQFFYDNDAKTFFVDEIEGVYRSQSEVVYKPYSTFVEKIDYVDFLLPTVESIRALGTDYFRDENLEVWVSGQYLLYNITSSDYTKEKDFNAIPLDANRRSKFEDNKIFESKDVSYIEIPKDVIFIYHDSVGFDKIVADNIEDDYFKLLLSRYTLDVDLNDTIFSEDFKLKGRKFLDFFDEEISALTAVQYSDKDLAEYYITSLREDGALILLLNLDMRKIDLYRNAGNVKLADKLEDELRMDNLSYYVAFNDSNIFDFCKVYVSDAKNRPAILAGETKNLFLDENLEVDSSIILSEDFYLFVRKGQVFETQLADPDNSKKKKVTSTPVIQSAMVIYDRDNVQVMPPFPFYMRIATAQVGSKTKKKKKKSDDDEIVETPVVEFDKFSAYVQSRYDLDEIDDTKLPVALKFNRNLYSFYNSIINGKRQKFSGFRWRNDNIWTNGSWENAPQFYHHYNNPNYDYAPLNNFPNVYFQRNGFPFNTTPR